MKAKGTSSWVHDHFLVYMYMISMANCSLCRQDGHTCDLLWKGSTSTLTTHIKAKHRGVFAAEMARQATADVAAAAAVVDAAKDSTSPFELSMTATKEMSIVKFIIHAGLPKETVENDAFNEMMKAHVPNYQRMGKYRLMTLLSEKYAAVKVSLAGILTNTRGAVTTDGWTSTGGHSYYGFTYHWIDDEWELHSIPVGICRHKGKTTAEDHVKAFEVELGKHGLTFDNIVALTTDTEPTMNSAGRLIMARAAELGFPDVEHVGCVDHILNGTTKLAGTDPKDDIDNPQNPQHVGALKDCRKLCGTFSHSSQLQEKLLALQEGERKKKTMNDVVTRWWSTYSMIVRLLHLRDVIKIVCDREKVTNLNPDQWSLLDDIVRLLEPFMLAQKLLEGEKYVTISLVPSVIEGLRMGLKAAVNDPTNNDYVSSMLKVLMDDFTTEWGSGIPDTQFDEHKGVGFRKRHVGYRLSHMLGAFLDPRTKELVTFGLSDRAKIEDELKQRAMTEAKKQQAQRSAQVEVVDGSDAPQVDEYRSLFTKTLPVSSVCTIPLQGTDCELSVSIEILRYKREGVLGRLCNPLAWWAQNQKGYPILSAIARRILCVPATSAPVERLFSYAGLTISNDRNRLLPENAEEIIFLRVAWKKVAELLSKKRKR